MRSLLAVLLVGACLSRAAPEAPVRQPLRISRTNYLADARAEWSDTIALPGQRDLFLHAPQTAAWADGHAIAGHLVWPAEAPRSAQLMAFMKDRDGHWFQKLRPEPLHTGTNGWSFDFSAEAPGWSPVGHHLVWNYRARLAPQMVGLRVFSLHEAYTGACQVVDTVLLATNRAATPPADWPAADRPRPVPPRRSGHS